MCGRMIGTKSAPSQHQVSTKSAPIYHQFGINLASTWHQLGTNLAPTCHQSGTNLPPAWPHIDTTLANNCRLRDALARQHAGGGRAGRGARCRGSGGPPAPQLVQTWNHSLLSSSQIETDSYRLYPCPDCQWTPRSSFRSCSVLVGPLVGEV
jgi:hypothetical protein